MFIQIKTWREEEEEDALFLSSAAARKRRRRITNSGFSLLLLLTRVLCGFLFGAEDPYFKILMITSADIRGEGRGATAVSVIAIGGRVRRARI